MSIYDMGRDAPVDYTIDWGPGWLGGADIVGSGWSVDGDGSGALVAVARSAPAGRTAVRLAGDTPGRYTVRGHVRLSDGRRATRSLTLRIGGGR